MSRQTRILHVVGSLTTGGIETWLLNVLRIIDRDRYRLDFLVHSDEAATYDDAVRAMGSDIHICAHTKQPIRYSRTFKEILREYEPYDVVHSHVDRYSGFVMRLSAESRVPTRIAHSHLDSAGVNAVAGVKRKSYLALMHRWINRFSTDGLAVSEAAGRAMYERDWGVDPRFRKLYCGIDTLPFHNAVDRRELRAELGLPADAFVLGHVGRFREQKNHTFLLDIANEVIRRDSNVFLLLIGEGELRPAVEERVRQLGLEDRVIFAGRRDDVAHLLMGAVDVFVFPSNFEGLGLALVEAQAAGLPCVVSDVNPEEAIISPELVKRLSLTAPPSDWATAILSVRGEQIPARAAALAAVEASPFDIRQSVASLEAIYASA
jgi:glycosyltransferase involved in cell wall biosynthesis